MVSELKLATGAYSDKGRKEINQDFHGVCIPRAPLLQLKGIVAAIADGISSSNVSHVASQSSIKSFIEDYYCTSEAWSAKTSAERVLRSVNSWLYSQTHQSQYRFDRDRGYVCTFSAAIFKSTTAHIIHVGDSRVYRLRGRTLEQLTEDHRTWVSSEQSYLARALGAATTLSADYLSVAVELGDIFLLTTDGVHEHISPEEIVASIDNDQSDLDKAAQQLVQQAFDRGSDDNLTVQLIRIDELPDKEVNEVLQQLAELPLPPLLQARMEFDGYRIIRELHGSHRSYIYLATDGETNETVVIKIPSIDLRSEPVYLERFLMEEWIARRITNAHVLKPCSITRQHNYVYVATEYIEGITLSQWMIDNPGPGIEQVRNIVEQIALGLAAFHRMEMLHQDLRPENIMIDHTGTVKIIDFGAVRVAGIAETLPNTDDTILGTLQYTAPEYFLGEGGSPRSDLFSLGVITYQMLSGKLPYGPHVSRVRSRAALARLIYDSILDDDREIPAWIDGVLKKAVHPDPCKRYDELSEFMHDLRHPTQEFLSRTTPPLIERNPVKFWKGVSLMLLLIVIWLLMHIRTGHV